MASIADINICPYKNNVFCIFGGDGATIKIHMLSLPAKDIYLILGRTTKQSIFFMRNPAFLTGQVLQKKTKKSMLKVFFSETLKDFLLKIQNARGIK